MPTRTEKPQKFAEVHLCDVCVSVAIGAFGFQGWTRLGFEMLRYSTGAHFLSTP